jgi:hypothetical protein
VTSGDWPPSRCSGTGGTSRERSLRLRPSGAKWHGLEAGADRGPQGDAGKHARWVWRGSSQSGWDRATGRTGRPIGSSSRTRRRRRFAVRRKRTGDADDHAHHVTRAWRLHRHRTQRRADEVQIAPRSEGVMQHASSRIADHRDRAGRQARAKETAAKAARKGSHLQSATPGT